MNIGINIKNKRQELGMLQTELAEKLDVSPKTISSWEINRTEPNIGMIEKLCEVFQCKKTDIIGNDIEWNPKTQEITTDVDYTLEDSILIETFHRSDELNQKMVLKILGLLEDKQ